MQPLYFVFALHNHQPVGNFDGVFKEGFERSYGPFLDLFEKTSKLKICLHTSGPLLDWLEANEPHYLKRLAKLAKKGRVEIMSGGYYEPLLPVIREKDALGQIEMMNHFIKRQFAQKAKGFWLTERVWEPSLPILTEKAGLSYVPVDDTHFFYAGLSTGEVFEYFITESQGSKLAVFPINKKLRYAVPFHPVKETQSYFEELRHQGVRLVTLADDGEKFGMWPGTYHSVYEEKWLEQFFAMLEESSGWLKTVTFSEALKLVPPRGRVYLPTASYEEMLEWALPARQTIAIQNFQKELKEKNIYEQGRSFVRGGFFRNFFAKYPEAMRMQAKQIYVSEKLEQMKNGRDLETARRELYKGECNCPYWHGVFGGLYLHHLRRAIFEHLIHAESLIDNRKSSSFKTRERELDFNLDGRNEVVVETKDSSLVFVPHQGAALIEWDDIKARVNVLDTMTRRFESYHEEIQRTGITPPAQDGNIHEMKREITKEIFENLIFDQHERVSAIDRVFLNGTPADFRAEKIAYLSRLETQNYCWQKEKGWTLFQTKLDSGTAKICLTRRMRPIPRGIEIEMGLELLEGSVAPFYLGSEWNLNLKTTDQTGENLKEWAVVDEWSSLEFTISSRSPFSVYQFTIQTVSQSERSYQLNPQGTCVMPFWPVAFKRKKHISWKWKVGVKEK